MEITASVEHYKPKQEFPGREHVRELPQEKQDNFYLVLADLREPWSILPRRPMIEYVRTAYKSVTGTQLPPTQLHLPVN
ncbi:MAG: hypothetical protein OXR66_01590 [Candidatus Woesearchaeota archaeon]|nr:hypothetical protein [Candidatus Woesearchaeota archaeon]